MATTHVEPIALNLLKAGAVMSAQNNSVWTALMYAVQNGHEQVALHVLLEAKADPNKANSDGFTALMFASQNGHDRCTRGGSWPEQGAFWSQRLECSGTCGEGWTFCCL